MSTPGSASWCYPPKWGTGMFHTPRRGRLWLKSLPEMYRNVLKCCFAHVRENDFIGQMYANLLWFSVEVRFYAWFIDGISQRFGGFGIASHASLIWCGFWVCHSYLIDTNHMSRKRSDVLHQSFEPQLFDRQLATWENDALCSCMFHQVFTNAEAVW